MMSSSSTIDRIQIVPLIAEIQASVSRFDGRLEELEHERIRLKRTVAMLLALLVETAEAGR